MELRFPQSSHSFEEGSPGGSALDISIFQLLCPSPFWWELCPEKQRPLQPDPHAGSALNVPRLEGPGGVWEPPDPPKMSHGLGTAGPDLANCTAVCTQCASAQASSSSSTMFRSSISTFGSLKEMVLRGDVSALFFKSPGDSLP